MELHAAQRVATAPDEVVRGPKDGHVVHAPLGAHVGGLKRHHDEALGAIVRRGERLLGRERDGVGHGHRPRVGLREAQVTEAPHDAREELELAERR